MEYVNEVNFLIPSPFIFQYFIMFKVMMESCGSLPNIESAIFFGNISTQVGSVIKFNCSPGYHLDFGPGFVLCLDNGKWSNPGVCVRSPITSCGHLPYIENGYFRIGNTVIGSKRFLMCDRNYHVEGDPWATCHFNGSWIFKAWCVSDQPVQLITEPQNRLFLLPLFISNSIEICFSFSLSVPPDYSERGGWSWSTVFRQLSNNYLQTRLHYCWKHVDCVPGNWLDHTRLLQQGFVSL